MNSPVGTCISVNYPVGTCISIKSLLGTCIRVKNPVGTSININSPIGTYKTACTNACKTHFTVPVDTAIFLKMNPQVRNI